MIIINDYVLQETLAETAGYYLESYQTTTVDGYQLVIHRLLKKGSNRKNNGNKPVVLLQHGIAQSSADWLINDSGKSMGKSFLNNKAMIRRIKDLKD